MTPGKLPRLSLDLMALRAIKELKEGDVVFPGFGIPMDAMPQYISAELGITLISENGIVGYGQILSDPKDWEPEAVNAAAYPVTLEPGACYTSQLDMFIAIGGRHRIDIAFLGAYQVSEKGDIANWMSLERGVANLGGAMGIAAGAKRVVVLMKQTDSTGSPRIVKECSQPISARRVVNLIITDMAVIEVTQQGLLLKEIVSGVSVEELQALTEPKLLVSDDLSLMGF